MNTAGGCETALGHFRIRGGWRGYVKPIINNGAALTLVLKRAETQEWLALGLLRRSIPTELARLAGAGGWR